MVYCGKHDLNLLACKHETRSNPGMEKKGSELQFY
jgi:hypothetical protein